jgi:Tyrosine-protein kinase ephrin type A/B receptor-like
LTGSISSVSNPLVVYDSMGNSLSVNANTFTGPQSISMSNTPILQSIADSISMQNLNTPFIGDMVFIQLSNVTNLPRSTMIVNLILPWQLSNNMNVIWSILYKNTTSNRWKYTGAFPPVVNVMDTRRRDLYYSASVNVAITPQMLATASFSFLITELEETIMQSTCPFCNLLSCAPGTYEDTSCNCKTCDICTSGTYETIACSSKINRNCTACAPMCANGTYETTSCTINTNRICSSCLIGSYCTMGIQTPCAVNQYQPNTRQSNCLVCPKSLFTSVTGSTSCKTIESVITIQDASRDIITTNDVGVTVTILAGTFPSQQTVQFDSVPTTIDAINAQSTSATSFVTTDSPIIQVIASQSPNKYMTMQLSVSGILESIRYALYLDEKQKTWKVSPQGPLTAFHLNNRTSDNNAYVNVNILPNMFLVQSDSVSKSTSSRRFSMDNTTIASLTVVSIDSLHSSTCAPCYQVF